MLQHDNSTNDKDVSATMKPAGYMAKRIASKPDGITADGVVDVFSLSGCISTNFADYVGFWKHNGYWLFDSPEVIEQVARDNSIDLSGTTLFYYEVYKLQFDADEGTWVPFEPEDSFGMDVLVPATRKLEGYDVVTFFARSSPECSPLSCNYLANSIGTNAHCLIESFEEAKEQLEAGKFNHSEPGPYRIFAVYTVPSVSSLPTNH